MPLKLSLFYPAFLKMERDWLEIQGDQQLACKVRQESKSVW
ncbi:hypothetical protein PROFUN_16948 [Planoprotostelium fungivorum]|uniref:Uncharacterized protein n=1 Tax=Planoprotostelium fungivorum TaxID=1890364 RepID=A0A2P6MMW7_9EUKA|nr:hypothetical protein PROFUN_16948 [Planoprotostelium fungivorum]